MCRFSLSGKIIPFIFSLIAYLLLPFFTFYHIPFPSLFISPFSFLSPFLPAPPLRYNICGKRHSEPAVTGQQQWQMSAMSATLRSSLFQRLPGGPLPLRAQTITQSNKKQGLF
jgi:hypothetical protein